MTQEKQKFTQEFLGKFLGTWKYESKGVEKYYKVGAVEDSEHFVIFWGSTLEELGANDNKIIISDSGECYRRILSKARGGYVLLANPVFKSTIQKCFDEFDSIEEVLEAEKVESRKRKSRTRKISLIDWMSGKDEYRENEKD